MQITEPTGTVQAQKQKHEAGRGQNREQAKGPKTLAKIQKQAGNRLQRLNSKGIRHCHHVNFDDVAGNEWNCACI